MPKPTSTNFLQKGRRPNILLITADQWRGDCLSAVSHACVKTPNVDALAKEGVLFQRHYAGAAPCSPARATLYTGLYQMNHRVCRNGSPLDARFDNLALAARRAGYDPTLFGYTDTAPDPRTIDAADPHLTTYEGVLPGFTARQLLPEHEKPWLSWLRSRGHDARSRDIHIPVGAKPGEISDAAPAYSKDETQSAFLTEELIRWVGEQDQPWMAHISFLRPHPPFSAPAPYNRMFSAQGGPAFLRSATSAEEAAAHPYLAYSMPRAGKGSFIHGAMGSVTDWQSEDFAKIRAIYYGMIAEIDAQLGRIWRSLKDQGIWDDTIIVFTSDHAEMAGDHWTLGKGGFFDGSYHIPLVIRNPANAETAGTQIDRFTSAADVFPTLCDLMQVSPGNHIDGTSLRCFIEADEPSRWRDAIFWEFDFRDIAGGAAEQHFGLRSNECNLAVIRDADFKYIHFAGLAPLLFDLSADPMELRNVAQDAAYAGTRLLYAEKLLSFRARHLDQTLAYTELTEKGPVSYRP